MYELYPYITNDGTVGLFSPNDDDIYHSTYGALSESWQKFIIPSRLEEYINTHKEVKILDVCYGIGYNSKTALQVFVNNFQKNKKSFKNNSQNFSKKPSTDTNSIEAIDTDNISSDFGSKTKENIKKNSKEICSSILIDAVDIDKILINLSPFIRKKVKNNFTLHKHLAKKYSVDENSTTKLLQIQKIIKQHIKPIRKIFRLKQEISMIILAELSKHYNLDDPILLSIINSKKYSPFLSKFMINFAKFYLNQGSCTKGNKNKSTFLHNIYYRYISWSYKRMQNVLSNTSINMNFYANDARNFIQSTQNTYNFIFIDAFTPSKCPALWTLEFFKELYLKLNDDGVIVTYSSSAAVRNALLQNGFCVGKIFNDNSSKCIGTIASKNHELIPFGLNERDLALIKSRAGICFKDEKLNLDNKTIIDNRDKEVEQSDLISSSKALKGDNSVESV